VGVEKNELQPPKVIELKKITLQYQCVATRSVEFKKS
jgi:hypothetical protein